MTRGSAPNPPTPSPTDVLWTMRKDHRCLTAEMRSVEDAWQLRLFADHLLLLWYTAPSCAAALQLAELIQADCVDDGWLLEAQ